MRGKLEQREDLAAKSSIAVDCDEAAPAADDLLLTHAKVHAHKWSLIEPQTATGSLWVGRSDLSREENASKLPQCFDSFQSALPSQSSMPLPIDQLACFDFLLSDLVIHMPANVFTNCSPSRSIDSLFSPVIIADLHTKNAAKLQGVSCIR